MGFLARSTEKWRLRSRLNRFNKEPSRSTLVDLVQCYLRMGDAENAWRFTSWGMEQYPESELIRELHRTATRERALRSLQEVRKELEDYPSPQGFLRVAHYALQVRDAETALDALKECIRRYPTCGPAHAGLAQIYERRYFRDLATADALAVVQHSRRASRLDPTSYEQELRLSRFFLQLGALQEAQRAAEQVLVRDSRCQEARAIVEHAQANETEEREDLEVVLRRIEEEGRLPGDAHEKTRIRKESERLRWRLAEVARRLRARRALVLDAEGEAWDEQGPIGVDALVNLAANLSRTAHLTTRRAGLGPLRAVTMETSGGALVLRRGSRSSVACLLPKDASILGSQDALRELVDGPTKPTGATKGDGR